MIMNNRFLTLDLQNIRCSVIVIRLRDSQTLWHFNNFVSQCFLEIINFVVNLQLGFIKIMSVQSDFKLILLQHECTMKSEGMAQFLSIATWDRAFSESTTATCSRTSYYVTGHLTNQIPLSNNDSTKCTLSYAGCQKFS